MRITRIRVVAVALTAVLLASIGLASFAFGADPKPTGLGTYQVAVWSTSYGYGSWIDLTEADTPTTLLAISIGNIGIPLWYKVECDGYANSFGNREFRINIGLKEATLVDDDATRRYYQAGDADSYHMVAIHTEKLYYYTGGAHAFYFRATPRGTGDKVRFNYMTITVTVFTDGTLKDLNPTTEAAMSDNGT